MKRIFANKSIITFLLVIVCFVILVVAYNQRVTKIIRPISVPVAAKQIKARTLIDNDMLKTIKFPSSMITSDVMRNSRQIIGKYVNYNTEIPAGSLIYKSQITEWKNMPDSAWKDLKDGTTVFSLNVNSRSTYGNSIYPGNKIDLYFQNRIDGLLVYGKLIEGIDVLAVKDGNGNHIFGKTANQPEAAALIFQVDEEMFRLLKGVSLVYGNSSLIPVPRNQNYVSETTISSSQLKTLIERKITILPDDAKENNSINITE